MLPLRYAAQWQMASALFLFLVLVAALMPAFWFLDDKVAALSWFEKNDKWVHGATFLALSMWFTGLFRRGVYWRVAIGLLVFGLVIEGCQRMISYRTADWIDIAANMAGIVVGLSIGLAGLGGWCQRAENRLVGVRGD